MTAAAGDAGRALLERHYNCAVEAIAAARAAPLSRRKAMLAILLVDAAADALFAASGADDVLKFRDRLAEANPALALVFAVAAMREGGPRLVVEAVPVPLEDYSTLDVADFMVSLYNGHSVQRVLVATGDARRDVHEVLAAVGVSDLASGVPPSRK